MGGPVERPVPDDSAPEQAAAAIQRVAPTPDTTIDRQVPSPYGQERRGLFGVSGTGDTSGFGGLVREPWVPPTAERPYGSYFDEVVDALYEAYPDAGQAINQVVVDRDELTLHIAREHLIGVATVLRDDPNLRFELCSSVSGVDYLGTANRLHSVVHLTSMTYRRRMRLEIAVSVEDPHMPSL